MGRQSVGRLACGETVSWNRAILVLSLGSRASDRLNSVSHSISFYRSVVITYICGGKVDGFGVVLYRETGQ